MLGRWTICFKSSPSQRFFLTFSFVSFHVSAKTLWGISRLVLSHILLRLRCRLDVFLNFVWSSKKSFPVPLARCLLTRALVGSVYNATWWGGGIFLPLLVSPKLLNGSAKFKRLRKPCQICWGKSNFIDLEFTDDVTGQVKDEVFCRPRVF